jgi:hypothetical protein
MTKPGSLRNGAPFKDWDLPPALSRFDTMPSRPIMRRAGGEEPRRNDSTYLRTKCAFPNQPIVPTMTEA